ncbi:alkaline shock response membrane anchor protein AmaP [Thermophilibacter provencensis]|uniref:Alkaline shock response membrane anchor protein AmaP n=1 Tax=Thermophilibacter provencensis TaxID=1852386 RepID=A0ABT7V3K2_9ACTN|nr:alkaline shock response membrane anchor protein AmaP [Thermophilibacter provencensis]MDM8271061.1 alkaline shock response membrane anchor protein AmaP [Thermophilibacter provencensis]
MSGLKRLCMAVFVLANALALAAFALTWFGPWTTEASALFNLEPYVIAVLVCLAVSALGMLVLLCRALFSRRTVRTVEIATVDGGIISVTRDAIAAQASHIVEADGSCTAARVRVDAKQRGHVRVHVRVLPHETVDVVVKGAELHEELMDGLAAVCGDKVEDVSLEFIEPESVTVAAADEGEGEARPASAPVPAASDATDSTSEITVSMGSARETPREG